MSDLDPIVVNASRQPDGVALVAGGSRWTWRDLEVRVRDIAEELARAGVGRGTRVALLAGDGAQTVVAVHGVRRLGAILVPLNRRATASEIGQLLDDARPAVLLHDEDRATAAEQAAAAAGTARGRRSGASGIALRLLSLDESPDGPPAAAGDDRLDPEAIATICFTSGTTGRPKGAVLTVGNHLASAAAWAAVLRPRPTDRWLACLPFHHVAGLAMILRSSLWAVPLHLAGGFDPEAIWRAFDEDAISHCSIVGSTLARLVEARGGKPAPATLRAVLVGAERTPADAIAAARRLGIPVMPTYGATETASGVTALEPAEADEVPSSAGRPLPGVELRVVAGEGADGRRVVSVDEIGEIEVRGRMVFAGYDGSPAETAAALADGWFRTGDLGSLDTAGRLSVADRRDDLIVSGGENVYPTEVEAVLRRHPAVADAAVVGRSDARWGAVPVALVVISSSAGVADGDLDAHCRARLAGFKVPVAFVRVASIPRTAGGKLLRHEARTILEAASADPGPSGTVGRR